MSAGAPWSVKGIDPKAREVAKELARRSGMTLGEWLNRVILEDDVPEEVTAEEQFAGRPRRTSHDPNVEAFRPAALAPQRPDSERIALVRPSPRTRARARARTRSPIGRVRSCTGTGTGTCTGTLYRDFEG